MHRPHQPLGPCTPRLRSAPGRPRSSRCLVSPRGCLRARTEFLLGFGACFPCHASIAAIAAEAQVSEETVYARFRNKRTLLGELVRSAVRGDDSAPVPEQQGPRAIATATDQHEQLRLSQPTSSCGSSAPLRWLRSSPARTSAEDDDSPAEHAHIATWHGNRQRWRGYNRPGSRAGERSTSWCGRAL